MVQRDCVDDDEGQEEAHFLILDYLAYQATQALLDSLDHNANKKDQDTQTEDNDHVQRNLELFNSYKVLFRLDDNEFFPAEVPRALSLRLQLLQFTACYHTQCNPTQASKRVSVESMFRLRGENKERAELWWDMRTKTNPAWAEQEQQYRTLLFRELREKKLTEEQKTERYMLAPTLCDLIPGLVDLTIARMQLIAHMNNLDEAYSNVKLNWFLFAAEFMLQACAEDLSYAEDYPGSYHDKFREAFSWGFVEEHIHPAASEEDTMDIDNADAGCSSDVAIPLPTFLQHESNKYMTDAHACPNCRTDAQKVVFANRIFGQSVSRPPSDTPSDDDNSLVSWEDIRRDYMSQLAEVLHSRKTATDHEQHSRAAFHASVVGYLQSLLHSTMPPLLTQLENDGEAAGDIDLDELDLTSEESDLLRKMFREFPALKEEKLAQRMIKSMF